MGIFGGNIDINDVNNGNVEAAGGDIIHTTNSTSNDSMIFVSLCVTVIVLILLILCFFRKSRPGLNIRQEGRNNKFYKANNQFNGGSYKGSVLNLGDGNFFTNTFNRFRND